MSEVSTSSITTDPLDPKTLIDELTEGLRETAQDVVPWFVANMPPMYFQDTDHATQLGHLRAIIAAKASGRPIELTLRSEDGSQWTLVRPLDYPGVLAELVSELPHDRPLRAAKIHTAIDGQLVLDTFEFGEADRFDPQDPKQRAKLELTIAHAVEHEPDWTAQEITEQFERLGAEYVLTVTPLRICRHIKFFRRVSGTDGTAVSLEPETDPSQSRIVVAIGNATTRTMLERIATRLSRSSINIHRAYLDLIDDGANGSISLLGFVVQTPEGGPLEADSDLWKSLRKDLIRLKWLDERSLSLAYRHPDLDLTRAEIIIAFCHLVHQLLLKTNRYAFELDRIVRLAERNILHSSKIADLMLARFNPNDPLDDERFETRKIQLLEQIASDVDLEEARTVLSTMIKAVEAIKRTNVYVENRYALSFRLDPNLLADEQRPEVPFGVFFVHGRSFNGFHVRFREIARGGVRVVRTVSPDQHAREAERLFDEAYYLASAQQLKNKDIPEGGAKATILLDPTAKLARSVKAFVDAILDLITPDPQTQQFIVDRLGFDELLYLGPDENITPELIDWIVDRAARRGYPSPTALMSSKPGAGINHKRYGVTSEGITVFLDVALRSVGINPTQQPFTIKITGGPDGDVAGNEIKILDREYGNNARIVGIADGSGVGEDPDGLDHTELLRLVENTLPISHFNRKKLGPNGRIVALEEPDGVHLRNTMHNRIVADAFIPAGGRPNAIHDSNWQEYLLPDGKPSSPVIVEGANLFLTPQARTRLSERGTLIIKDSSANKCGVICSSFEIVASMLLSEEEFLEIKDIFVEQVLEKLRMLAKREAELLLRLHRHYPPVPLPAISERLSRVMIRAADAIEEAIEDLENKNSQLVRQLVIDHLPEVLVAKAGNRLWTDTPRSYLKWIMAKSLAARIVYREGFESLELMPATSISDLATKYLKLELERRNLIDEVDASDLPNRQRIAKLLADAGILTTIGNDDDDED
ncbi:MAG: NAD-glutamate dehydrogenase [Planctomycetes bacterium]|nr:NAD-glutamate dehydrogenase [Planctomycetota bacterium]